MNKNKKIIIPKVRKKIKGFLTDESGKITKQAALGMTAGTFFALGLEETAAAGGGTGHSSYSHGNTLSCGAPSHTSNLGHANVTGGCATGSRSGHVSGGTLSGHGNATGHSSHGSHSSHVNDFCFTADQLVLTPTGSKEISKVTVGDEIISYSEETDQITTSIVEYCIVHDGQMYHKADFSKRNLLKIGIQINGETIYTKATENHPYFDLSNCEYKKIRDFNIGDKIKLVEGEGVLLSKDVIFDNNDSDEAKNTIVYNLHMKDGTNHNYFINGALVHNAQSKR